MSHLQPAFIAKRKQSLKQTRKPVIPKPKVVRERMVESQPSSRYVEAHWYFSMIDML